MKQVSKIGIALIFFIIACNTTRITSSWKADNIQPREYKKILVLGLINEPDRTVRERMEEHMVGDLRDLGYDAVCSCDEYNPKAFENMKEQEALTKLSNSGIDAVLTVVLLDKQKERYYVPGRVYYSPYYVYHNRFWGYYSTMYGRVYSPGYYTTDTKYFWESNFYNLDKGPELLYSAQSQSFNPGSANDLSHEYAQMIVKDLAKKNILTNQKEARLKPM
ncbi:MAG: hypothetical protein Q8941_22360 [Bacteroidota bacterium]|nr:hypothetical protein [Bacteroidota bacterium]